MSLEKIHKVYFIGVGGIGMSALARYFIAIGKEVFGYDKTETILTNQLEKEGVNIHYTDSPSLIPSEIDLVVYTPAVPQDLKEYKHCWDKGYVMKKRSEVLGIITNESFTLAVAGTHGKTTTSSILAHLLKQSIGCNAFLGGITKNYDSNVLLTENTENTVVEADEYDRSFLELHSNMAIITSMDADHLDIYGDHSKFLESFELFSSQISPGGSLILNKQLENKLTPACDVITYSISEKADYYLENIKVVDGYYVFSVQAQSGLISDIKFGLPGRHNVENAIAAIAAADQLKVSHQEIKSALESFKGIKRRFEYIIKKHDLVYIDDYAHHPEELKATISSVKELYPKNKITGVFQPHLYSRTKDFADDFAKSLDLLNELILLDIYPSREQPIEGITSEMLLRKVTIKNKSISTKAELVSELRQRKLEVLLTMGAGDIDKLVEPIKNELLN
ncbi:MAG: UDP-N-acetylmuramate--L-alanine ligase [Flavobacteriales bacterium]|jgi:UDP-N-acetylmuramate--alanine ligase|nr:UDP-N-acetylmuramate--L-alanine ligase [Flavobacteriales bacterium]MBT6746910.1 UDP-N-acetylmuramate--L-alanine ligase [Flavobacteriales bacterium]